VTVSPRGARRAERRARRLAGRERSKLAWDKNLAAWLLIFGGLGLVLAALAAVFGYMAVHERELKRLSEESRDWPHVTATIVRSRVEKRHSSGRVSTTSYSADVEYRYAVDGRAFVGSRTSFDPPGSLSDAKEIVQRYRQGDTVEAWYRPRDPSVSTLQTDNWDGEGSVFLGALGAVLFGALALVLFMLALWPFGLGIAKSRS